MDPFYSVIKKEYSSGGSSASGGGTGEANLPQPMEGLHDAGPPPFLTKIYEMVDDQSIDHIVCWSRGGQSFVVLDPHAFSTNLLPRYFKHNNFSSFVRQLNTYGFRKIDPDVWEFANEAFLRGQRQNLKYIKRRKTPSQVLVPPQATPPCVELGNFGLDGEVTRLRRDKHVLMMELVKLRQQQQVTRAHLQEMETRLQGTEKKQQKMMNFLAKAMQNPEFVQKLVKSKELEEALTKKRRCPIDQGHRSAEMGESSQSGEGSKLIKAEPEELGGILAFQVSELETLALEMQGFGRGKRSQGPNEFDEFDGGDRELDDEFWEELFSQRFDEHFGMDGIEGGVMEDVNSLADKLDFLGSSPK